MKLNPNLYWYCNAGKNPNMGKIRRCCFEKFKCRHLKSKPRKTSPATAA